MSAIRFLLASLLLRSALSAHLRGERQLFPPNSLGIPTNLEPPSSLTPPATLDAPTGFGEGVLAAPVTEETPDMSDKVAELGAGVLDTPDSIPVPDHIMTTNPADPCLCICELQGADQWGGRIMYAEDAALQEENGGNYMCVTREKSVELLEAETAFCDDECVPAVDDKHWTLNALDHLWHFYNDDGKDEGTNHNGFDPNVDGFDYNSYHLGNDVNFGDSDEDEVVDLNNVGSGGGLGDGGESGEVDTGAADTEEAAADTEDAAADTEEASDSIVTPPTELADTEYADGDSVTPGLEDANDLPDIDSIIAGGSGMGGGGDIGGVVTSPTVEDANNLPAIPEGINGGGRKLTAPDSEADSSSSSSDDNVCSCLCDLEGENDGRIMYATDSALEEENGGNFMCLSPEKSMELLNAGEAFCDDECLPDDDFVLDIASGPTHFYDEAGNGPHVFLPPESSSSSDEDEGNGFPNFGGGIDYGDANGGDGETDTDGSESDPSNAPPEDIMDPSNTGFDPNALDLPGGGMGGGRQ